MDDMQKQEIMFLIELLPVEALIRLKSVFDGAILGGELSVNSGDKEVVKELLVGDG